MNNGTLKVSKGTLATSVGGTGTGTYNLLTGTTLDLNGGLFDISGATVTGAGNFNLNGGASSRDPRLRRTWCSTVVSWPVVGRSRSRPARR